MKKTLVNTETDRDVGEFLEAVSNKQRREDGIALCRMIEEVTGKKPKIWGRSIVGFGKYSYKRKNGEEYEWFNVGFSPAKAHLSVYLMYDVSGEPELLSRLGPHKMGKGCLYIKKLADVDEEVLRAMIAKSDRWS